MNITNKIRILCEEACEEFIWYKHIFNGLIKELRKRRIAYEQINCIDHISADDIVCVIGMSNDWIEKSIGCCNEADCVPIVLSNQSGCDVPGRFHLICSDIPYAVQKLKNVFADTGRTKIALYGADYSVDFEKDRATILSSLVRETSDIYINTGNLENCFLSFRSKAAFYDAVVCVNGYAAISLVKRLEKENKELLEKLVIVSCEEILKHSRYSQWISLIDLNLESYGGAALTIMEMISLGDVISSVVIKMKAEVCSIAEKEDSRCDVISRDAGYYEDPEIIHMAKIEQLLQDADDLDHHIIAMLLDNSTYAEIADTCYMTEGNIKYRVKKYMSVCECKTKKQLLELLQEYLQ